MKPEANPLRTLLHEVLPSSADRSGPSSADVLRLLRDEHRRRVRSRRTTALLAGLGLLLFAALRRHGTPVTVPVAGTAPEAAAVIHRVSDAELFVLLKDTPAALVKLPDGTSRLLVLDQ